MATRAAVLAATQAHRPWLLTAAVPAVPITVSTLAVKPIFRSRDTTTSPPHQPFDVRTA
ncbi:hypothetical protein [Catenulispora pinisilvae]|uniref:hypothetical protein n=1 Tax=Catenulispora pinisilvae TaxID=2705253 RepID=UPI00189172AD|nr:hypothetical protein [Catenulispora pinisilvae]